MGAFQGRGSVRDVPSRFVRLRHEPAGDLENSGDENRLPTEIIEETAVSIISTNDSPDVPFERSLNPTAGCEHGCVYCFARPSHGYRGFSPGIDFETKIVVKANAPELLRAALARPGYEPKTIVIGSNTDPYQPVERRLGLTRRLLQIFVETRHPVGIITKSANILNDLDLLSELARIDAVHVCVSVTTIDHRLARIMEPRASTPKRRLDAIRMLAARNIPCAVLASPMIPAMNDHELERILAAAAEAGATSAGYTLIRLPWELKELFEDWLEAYFPDRRDKVLNQIRRHRGGNLYDSAWSDRMSGKGPEAELLRSRFELACRRLRLEPRRWDLGSVHFRAPSYRVQPDLFDP
jgi:DNA repair photolyase